MFVAIKMAVVYRLLLSTVRLRPLATDAASKLDVFWHDGHTLGVDGAQVGVLEESDQVGLAGFLQGHDGRALESQIGLEILSNFTDETLERQLADEELGALLVATDLTEGNCSRPVTMGLLHTAGRWGTLPCGFGGQLLSGCLSTSGFTSGLLRSGHDSFGVSLACRRRRTFSELLRLNDVRSKPRAAICRPRQYTPSHTIANLIGCQTHLHISQFIRLTFVKVGHNAFSLAVRRSVHH